MPLIEKLISVMVRYLLPKQGKQIKNLEYSERDLSIY